jgi:DNA-binding MarR family transcriptional regulator
LQILVRKKLVKKDFKEGDRRHFLLSLTTKGELFFKQALGVVKSMRMQGVSDFADAEKEQIKKMLLRIIKNLES